jgi:hypothetical protein
LLLKSITYFVNLEQAIAIAIDVAMDDFQSANSHQLSSSNLIRLIDFGPMVEVLFVPHDSISPKSNFHLSFIQDN